MPPARRWYFLAPDVPSEPGVHAVTLFFEADGRVGFAVATDDPEECAAKLRGLLRELVESPALVARVAGIHTAETVRLTVPTAHDAPGGA